MNTLATAPLAHVAIDDQRCPVCFAPCYDHAIGCVDCGYRDRGELAAEAARGEAIARIEERLRRLETMPLGVHSPKLAAEMRAHVAVIRRELERVK